jgi:hypothetical protein
MMIEKFDVLNRWTGAVQFTAEIEVTPEMTPRFKLGLAIKWARINGAVLRDADLSGAVLRDADLSGADLSDADLSSAALSGADLSGAVLRDADLSGAVLRDADLSGADLSDADLRSFKADLWMTLVGAKAEIPLFIQSMLDGKIDGSQYEGECACLVGTLANVRGVSYATAFPDHSSGNPAEQWFLMIKKGDLPYAETGGGFALGKALDWTLEYCATAGVKLPKSLFTACLAAQDAAKQEQQQ